MPLRPACPALASAPALVLASALALATSACERGAEPPSAGIPRSAPGAPAAAPAPTYVGASRCTACHASEGDRWHGSQHALAMQEANAASVRGAFDGRRLDHFGVESVFFERDGRFFVNTEGPDAKRADFEVTYTFGVTPLQQYLVPLPGGRLQALGTAWDTRARSAGGERWFHLHPDEPTPPGDVLHWTQLSQRWNTQCAECHSTDLRKGYDATRAVYDTRWAELDVACEACHGPGSAHVAWADAGARGPDPGLVVRFPPRSTWHWVFAPDAPIAHREPALASHAELESCAPCHARRSTLREGRLPGEPLLDTHRPALLEAGLYEADGQMRDEVYVWGSFLQSRMYAAGVTCSDCHDPHSLALRASGNALCAQCHRPEVFDTPAHHHHTSDSAGASCVACHLPARTYMVVDVRHDHSFRVPRPDLSTSIGTPNACNDCHTDRPPSWAAAAVARWFPSGRGGSPHYGQALDAGRRRAPGAMGALVALARDASQPAIARATALSLLDARSGSAAVAALRDGLADADPLIRLGALEGSQTLDPATRLSAVSPRLEDPRLALRLDAARALADVPPGHWQPAERTRFAAALGELRAALALDADRPDAHVGLGLLALQQGDAETARREYETALRLAPWFVPAYVNLADLEQRTGHDEAGEAWLRRAIAAAPDVAEPHHALGLWLIRAGRGDEAAAELARAAELAPDNPRFAFAHALVVDASGDRAGALALLEAALARHGGDHDLLVGATSFAASLGEKDRALAHAKVLVAEWPDDPEANALFQQLQKPAAP